MKEKALNSAAKGGFGEDAVKHRGFWITSHEEGGFESASEIDDYLDALKSDHRVMDLIAK